MKITPHPTVLLVEDDDVDAMAVARAFSRDQPEFRLVRASDGLEGLEMLRQLSREATGPLVVLIDLNMPRMSGIELLAAIRGDKAISSAVAFVLTTSNDERDVASAYQHNVAGYIRKSMDSESMQQLAHLMGEYVQRVTFPKLSC